ncbi:MAG: DUF86 domain-containing protein [Prevotellaceae bacterium]|nr:DUF86 domain-containing protein [Prevotellaceae bacterium]
MQHIAEAISDILEFTAGASFSGFCGNKMLKHAVYRNLTLIGEAANLLTKAYRDTHSAVEWPKIIGMRHVLVHDYYEADDAIVWQTIVESLPQQQEQIRAIQAGTPARR